ncbi:MAG: hypothetical protein PUD59_03110 [bacterium]|nr:hypothetical protein [bacterium]
MEDKNDIVDFFKEKKKFEIKYKNKRIRNKDKAIKFLNTFNNFNELFYAYYFGISNELMIDDEIFNLINKKINYIKNSDYDTYKCLFYYGYGYECSKTHNDEIIFKSMEIAKKIDSLEYTFSLFDGIFFETVIPFNKYYELFEYYKYNLDVKVKLIYRYCNDYKREKSDYEIIKMLSTLGDECIKKYWSFFINSEVFSFKLYNYLVQCGVNKEELDKKFEYELNHKELYDDRYKELYDLRIENLKLRIEELKKEIDKIK